MYCRVLCICVFVLYIYTQLATAYMVYVYFKHLKLCFSFAVSCKFDLVLSQYARKTFILVFCILECPYDVFDIFILHHVYVTLCGVLCNDEYFRIYILIFRKNSQPRALDFDVPNVWLRSKEGAIVHKKYTPRTLLCETDCEYLSSMYCTSYSFRSHIQRFLSKHHIRHMNIIWMNLECVCKSYSNPL